MPTDALIDAIAAVEEALGPWRGGDIRWRYAAPGSDPNYGYQAKQDWSDGAQFVLSLLRVRAAVGTTPEPKASIEEGAAIHE